MLTTQYLSTLYCEPHSKWNTSKMNQCPQLLVTSQTMFNPIERASSFQIPLTTVKMVRCFIDDQRTLSLANFVILNQTISDLLPTHWDLEVSTHNCYWHIFKGTNMGTAHCPVLCKTTLTERRCDLYYNSIGLWILPKVQITTTRWWNSARVSSC